AGAGVLLIPWVAVSWSRYITALSLSAQVDTTDAALGNYLSVNSLDFKSLLSTKMFGYGNSLLDYSAILLLLITVALFAIMILTQRSLPQSRQNLGLVISACIAAVLAYWIKAYFFRAEDVVRYSCPELIAVVPGVLLLIARFVPPLNTIAPTPTMATVPGPRVVAILLAILPGVLIALFADTSVDRLERVRNQQTLVSFSINRIAINAFRHGISPLARTRIRFAQQSTIPGEVILVLNAAPFQFDFKRNPIYSITPVGLFNPWLRLPLHESADTVKDYLRLQHIRYVLFQYRGLGFNNAAQSRLQWQAKHVVPPLQRKTADVSFRFREALYRMARPDNVVFDNGSLLVMDLAK
ncbi:MAG: hypothetical protein V3S33_05890, partial [Gammaproteobacteria bacterium]